MVHREAVRIATVPCRDYRRVAREVVATGPDEPRYGAVDVDHLCRTWLTFVGARIATVIGAYVGKQCVGFIFGLCSQDPLTGEMYGTAYFWAVMPEYRKRGTAYKLLNAFEEWTKERGGVAVNVGVIESPKADKLARAYKMVGYRDSTRSLTKRFD